ncbi:MAG: hypothetical protein AB7P49_13265 [Bdellovibrionales bacterium]
MQTFEAGWGRTLIGSEYVGKYVMFRISEHAPYHFHTNQTLPFLEGPYDGLFCGYFFTDRSEDYDEDVCAISVHNYDNLFGNYQIDCSIPKNYVSRDNNNGCRIRLSVRLATEAEILTAKNDNHV